MSTNHHSQSQQSELPKLQNAALHQFRASTNRTKRGDIEDTNEEFVDTSPSARADPSSSLSHFETSRRLQPGPASSGTVDVEGNLTQAIGGLTIAAEIHATKQSGGASHATRSEVNPGDVAHLIPSGTDRQTHTIPQQPRRIALPSIQTRFNIINRGSNSTSRSRGKGSSSSSSSHPTSAFSNGGAYSTVGTPFTTYDSQVDSPEVSTALTTPSSGISYQYASRTVGGERYKSKWSDLQEDDEDRAATSQNVKSIREAPLKARWVSPESHSLSSMSQEEIVLINVATLQGWLQKADEMSQRRRSPQSQPDIGISTVKEFVTSGRPTTFPSSNSIIIHAPNNRTLIGSDRKGTKFPDQILGTSNLVETNPIPDVGDLEFAIHRKEKKKSDFNCLGSKEGNHLESKNGSASILPSISPPSGNGAGTVSSTPPPFVGSEDLDAKQSISHKNARKDALIDDTLKRQEPPGSNHTFQRDKDPLVLVIGDTRKDKSDHLQIDYSLLIGISDIFIDCYMKGERTAENFRDLTPFLMDHTSKRKYSTMMMNTPDGLQADEYWRGNVVIVDQEDREDESETAESIQSGSQQGQDDSDCTDATSITSSPSLSAAATVLVDATQKLRRMHEVDSRPIYVMKDDLTSSNVWQEDAKGCSIDTKFSQRDARPIDDTSKVSGQCKNAEILEDERLIATPLDPFSPSFAMRVSESPSNLHLDRRAQSRSMHTLPKPELETNQERATNNSPTLDAKPPRPTLARINTSENVKNLGEVDTKRSDSISVPSLTLTTAKLTPRSSNSKMKLNEPPLSLVHPRLFSSQSRRDTEPGHQDDTYVESSASSSIGNARSLSLLTGKSVTASFEASEIIKGFLYLGPDITTVTEVDYLKNDLGVKCILNAAVEIEDGGGKHLCLNRKDVSGIEKYKKIALQDLVEGQEIQGVMDEACVYIDEARKAETPIYVHCKAGKSRSVMLVMAYLIHTNHWTLQEAYAYVVERRREVSPNIGFVAELMAFEKRRLQTSKSEAPNVADM